MYSLPISTYSDYWRATKVWSSYVGGLAVFAAGTRYSLLGAPDITQTRQPTFQQITQSFNKSELETEVSFSHPRQRATYLSEASREVSRQGEVSQGAAIIQGEASRGEAIHSEISRGVAIQSEASRGVAIQGEYSPSVASQGISSPRTERISDKIEVVNIEIPFDTQYVESDTLLPGQSEIQEKGENGILRQVVKTFEADGKIIDQQVRSSSEFKSPKQEVILRNSKPIPKKKVTIQNSMPVVQEGLDLAKMNIGLTLNVESTAYTYTGNKTVTGVEPREGLIAVDPKVIAMGSKVYVEGYGYAIAADTGGAILGNRIDVFFPTLRQCIDWGRKSVHVYVLKPN